MENVLKKLYEGVSVKEPIEMDDYEEKSEYAVKQIQAIIQKKIDNEENQIPVMIGLKKGIPMENIHRIAAPIVEAWAIETFENKLDSSDYKLVGVEPSTGRTDFVDVILSFKRKDKAGFAANVDVKATAEDIKSSGKSPNITSFIKIRSAYVNDPDLLFIILSLKHSVYSDTTGEKIKQYVVVKKVNTYDLKHLSPNDFNLNPALGSGQIQIKDIHYVSEQKHTTTEFCRLIDSKFMRAKVNTKEKWVGYAEKNGWIK